MPKECEINCDVTDDSKLSADQLRSFTELHMHGPRNHTVGTVGKLSTDFMLLREPSALTLGNRKSAVLPRL